MQILHYPGEAVVRTVVRMSTTTNTITPTRSWTEVADEVGAGLAATVVDHDRSGELPTESIAQVRDAGLTAALVPAEFGGGGATHAEVGAALRHLGRHDPATALTLSMHTHLVAAQVWRQRHGIDAEKVLRAVAGGAILISTGASDWVSSNGTAERVDGGYRVSARKAPASGCEAGTIAVTSIRWESPEGPKVLHCSVPFSADGVRIERTWDTLGMRATGSHTIVFDDVMVPDASVSLVRPADVWHPVWNTVMGCAMPLIMAVYVGIADAAVDQAVAYLAGRHEEHVAIALGEMLNAHVTADAGLAAMFAMSDDLRFDNTDAHAGRTLSLKSVVTDAAISTVRLAMEAVSGSGYSRTSPLERLLRDVHASVFHPLPKAKQLPFSGRVALGQVPAVAGR